MPRIAEQQRVGRDAVAKQPLGHGRRPKLERRASSARGQDGPHGAGRKARVAIADDVRRRRLVDVEHDPRMARLDLGLPVDGGRHDEVGAKDEVGFLFADAHGMDAGAGRRNAHQADDRAVLLGQTRKVEDRGGLLVQMRGRAQQGAQGQNACSANARHIDVAGLVCADVRLRQGREALGFKALEPIGVGLAQNRAIDLHEAWAKALHAGEVLVAARLVDPALAAVGRFQRLDGDAVGLDGAVAAPFTDAWVDEQPAVGIGKGPTLAPAPLLGRAGLFVDDGRDPRSRLQGPLNGVQFVAVVDANAGRQIRAGPAIGIVAHQADVAHALGRQLPGQARRVQNPLGGLATGHGDGVVVEDLEGDVGFGGHGGANRQGAGVLIGAVAQVLEGVLGLREGRGAHPLKTLSAHLTEGRGPQLGLRQRHDVTANAAADRRTFRRSGRGVVGAARAEIGAADRERRRRSSSGGRERLDPVLHAKLAQ